MFLKDACYPFVIARKSALVMATNFSAGLLNYFTLFLIARYYALPKFALGIISFAYGFVALFNIIPNMGLPQAHIKRISEGKDIAKCNGTFFSLRLILTLSMILFVTASLMIWKYVLHRGFETSMQENAIYVMLAYFILLALSKNFTLTYRGKMEIALAQFPFFVEAVARMLSTSFFVFMGYDVIWLVYTYVIGGFAFFISSIIFFREPVGKPSREYISSYIKFAIPLSIVSVSFIIMTNIDKVLIQLFWGYDQGADYFSVVRFSRYINNVTVAFGMLLLPAMSAMHAGNKSKEMAETTVKAERYMSMIIMPIVFFMIFFAKPIIYIFLSRQFYTAIPIMQILPFFALLDALERPYQTRLLGMDLPTFARNRMLLMVVINIALNLLLIPRDIKSVGIQLAGLAGTGAAIATVVAYLAGLLYTRIVIYKMDGTGFNVSVAKHLVAALAMGFVTTYLNNFYTLQRWYELAAFSFLAFLVYLAFLILLREFRKEDWNLFMDTINPLKMISYIKDEMRRK